MQIMGILNTTPDSFSDGGLFFAPAAARRRIEDLAQNGADLIDIGAESTRPGSDPVSSDQEWQRLAPVLNELPAELVEKISIDTRHDATAAKAYDCGVRFFNNVAGLYSDRIMTQLGRDHRVSYCAMHMIGTPATMHLKPLNAAQSLEQVRAFFADCHQQLLTFGFSPDRIFLDPGVGFGKDDTANLALIQNAVKFSDCYNLLYGISRKSFIGRLFGIDKPTDRDAVSKVFELSLIHQRVKVIRTHNVELLKEILGKINGGIV